MDTINTITLQEVDQVKNTKELKTPQDLEKDLDKYLHKSYFKNSKVKSKTELSKEEI